MPEFPKPKAVRSQSVIDDIRNTAETCEIPTCPNRPEEVHHIKSKGSGGEDTRCNLIALCCAHHNDAQTYRIPQADLFRIVAQREGLTLAQVYSACGLDPPPELECWKKDVLVFAQLQKDEEESGWKIATHAAYMLGKYGQGAATKLARESGVSARYIRGLAGTARVFPGALRNPALSMTHHRIAAQTESPRLWLKRAAEEKWSVQELQEAIKGRHVDDGYRFQVERLESTVRKFNETWGTRGNIKAVLVWESFKAASA
ncbi:MAG: HNH endonuclease signature motif containing protein [Peptococcaceae bacterium]|nr:HNH endonuclease signature motif containing protein [Peptococcaceae bacterium]